YVTADLDQGPIIEQDVIRANHASTVQDMVRQGRDAEKLVLARGLRWHREDRVLVHDARTVVFNCRRRASRPWLRRRPPAARRRAHPGYRGRVELHDAPRQ